MKRTLAALAIFALTCSAVQAEPSVAIFGIIDAAVSHYGTKSSYYGNSPRPFTTPADVIVRQTALSNGGNLQSRLGFRGTEDLGGGMATSFWLESPLTNDDGAVGLTNFARRSTISFVGGMGEVRLGRDYTPYFWIDTLNDPFSNTGVGGSILGAVNGKLAATAAISGGGLLNPSPGAGPDNYVRTSNSIGYFLPPNLGGVYGQLQYALHENVKTDNVLGSLSRRGSEAGVRLGWLDGRLDISGSYIESTPVDAVAENGVRTLRKIKSAGIGATYDFGSAKLFSEFSRARDETRNTTPLGAFGLFPKAISNQYDGLLIGLTIPVGPGVVKAAYSRVKFKDDSVRVPQSIFLPSAEAESSKIAVGYVHNLSKRTALYASMARVRVKGGQNNPAVMGVTTGGAAAYLTTGTTSGYAPHSSIGYDVGIRHAF